MPIPTVTLYSRPGCHLCEVVKEQLETIRREMDFHIEERNIDEEASLRERYNDDIPVKWGPAGVPNIGRLRLKRQPKSCC